ncbi:antiviral reverse transcriptase Drt3a [Alcanivorax sp.]|uniref:antiviral reverse transcriptase Drt3a n=1 Tax=Alcanivorax sp. TaxID=1872427 RepID=UPI000C54D00B|nr:antiviral reverse transcriptase Drt3a [Alcanivorax sp.]MBQ23961.1 hypothetical protein [Alcanivorax sp.]|tara:strand:+ start:822 stop:2015 length:1194 start_codon:yes stop_codon:yes gene_type:complete
MRKKYYSAKSLSRNLKGKDFVKYQDLQDSEKKDEFLEAVESEILDPDLVSWGLSEIPGRKGFCTTDNYSSRVVMRAMSLAIREQGRIVYPNKNDCVAALCSYLQTDKPVSFLKIDLKKYFDSVSHESCMKVVNDNKVDLHTASLVQSVLHSYSSLGGEGLPQGLEVSNPLSELYLKEFDDSLNSIEGLLYCKRYVDDLVLIFPDYPSRKDAIKAIKSRLPNGLMINQNKTFFMPLSPKDNIDASFDYLGYGFNILINSKVKKVSLSLSQKRKKRMETKIYKSFLSYVGNKDYGLLVDRIRFLATNRRLIDKGASQYRLSGIYYDNSLLTSMDDLIFLDRFLKNTLLHSDLNGEKARFSMNNKQVSMVLYYSFKKGFQERRFSRFSPNRAVEITKIWR